MRSAWVGVAGVIIGFLLNAAFQWLREAGANRHADQVWRREKYVDAVAEYVHLARDMTSRGSAVTRATFADVHASQGRDPAIAASTREALQVAHARYEPVVEDISRARARVQIYAPSKVRQQTDDVWSAVAKNDSHLGVREMRAFEGRVYRAIDDLLSAVWEELP